MPATLVCVGACYLDTFLTVPHYPLEDSKLRATSLAQRRGGNGPNTLEVLSQLISLPSSSSSSSKRLSSTHTSSLSTTSPPLSLSLLSVLPAHSSSAAQLIRASLPDVDTSHCLYRPEHTEAAASYILKSAESGSRTIVNFSALPEMTADEFGDAVARIKDGGGDGGDQTRRRWWWHFEGRIPDVLIQCIRHLRLAFPSASVSVEMEKPGRAGLEELAAEADVLFISRGWAMDKGYKNAKECVRAQAEIWMKARLLCCTWGEDGAAVLELPSKRQHHVPAFEMSGFRVVDSTGAGDTFTAGMLFGLLCRQDDWPLERKLRFANELAGRKVAQEGFAGLGGLVEGCLKD